MSAAANGVFARSLVDEWARAGVRLAAVAPGSRSTPLALALAADPRIQIHVVLDERSAGFFALGAAKASGRATVVLCTSGTATGNLVPAVMEAWHARVPLVVCTADRPPELRDTGAGQATDQIKLFGDSVRWFCEVGAPAESGDPGYWRSVAARATTTALGPPGGPVHLNLAFREPLVAVENPTPDPPSAGDPSDPVDGDVDELVARLGEGGRADGRPWTTSSRPANLPSTSDVDRLVAEVNASSRGLLVAGWGAGVDPVVAQRFAAATGWPVMADALSGLRNRPSAVSTYDAFLRVDEVAERLQPDLVVHVGAALTAKVATQWLAASPRRIVIDPDGRWLDPHRSATDRIPCDANTLLQAVTYRLTTTGEPTLPASTWSATWTSIEDTARRVIDTLVDSWDSPFEGRIARDLVDCLPDGSTLVVGSSMPVRDIEAFARPRPGVRFLSNRGVNGIDGFTSTAFGAAAGWSRRTGSMGERVGQAGPVVAVCGDLTFLHDAGGLLGATRRGLDVTLVVVDNDGGGIFSFLPQAGIGEQFETLFGTPHGLDLSAVAAAYGVPSVRVDNAAGLAPAVTAAIDAGGVRVVIVTTDRTDNVARHRQVNDAVAAALRPGAR